MKEQLHQLLDYDKDTGVFTWKVKASIRSPAGSVAGTKNVNGYIVFKVMGKLFYAHRLAWAYVHGDMPSSGIDHINGNPSDNRLRNLREATQGQNNQNMCPRRKNSPYPIGVGFYKAYGKWTARIHKDKKEYFLGYFDSCDDAQQAYLTAKRKHHEFNPTQRGAPAWMA
jgi:hypothetical protein